MQHSLEEVVGGTWHSARAAAGTARDLYVLDRDSNVYCIDGISGAYVTSLGDRFDGDYLVIIDNKPHVFRGPATTLGGRIFTVENRTLYSTDPATGAYERLANSWDTRHLI